MTTTAQWLQGARPRTLPAAVAPVAVGTGAAVAAGRGDLPRALLALLVALALQVGVNYANDYSDGVRGTDADRVGPLRLVGSGTAPARTVRNAALLALAVGGLAGVLLAALSSWWLLVPGAAALVAAWTYTGGLNPYGYRALGEVSVFTFFGLVAVVGTCYAQVRTWTWLPLAAAVPVGLLACALLVVNNLRDLPRDAQVGKRTLAVVLQDRGTRLLFAGCLLVPLGFAVGIGVRRPPALVALLAVVLIVRPLRVVLGGATGPHLIPALRDTGRAQLGYGLLLALGLAFS